VTFLVIIGRLVEFEKAVVGCSFDFFCVGCGSCASVRALVSIKLFGKRYCKVHRAIDSAYWILGRQHR
jgi:hypothetical protein